MTRLVVLAWGNPSRGDDALGPEFLASAQRLVPPRGLDVEFVTDFQLQPEHAADLAGRDLALFVDASTRAPAPYAFAPAQPAHDRTFTSHAMSPGAVLAACADAFGDAPPAFTLAIRAHGFELGSPLGARARANLAQALEFYARLLGDARPAAWQRFAGIGAT
jgi:hydrogenase maturation protease